LNVQAWAFNAEGKIEEARHKPGFFMPA